VCPFFRLNCKTGIDQGNIDENLLCLPVFLAGCNRLVVMAGPSYLQRLWCLVELFVFLHIGGTAGNIDLALLGGDAEGDKEIVAGFHLVSSAEATCFHREDRERLQIAIEVGFGDTEAFDTMVSNVLTDVCLRGHHLNFNTLEKHGSSSRFSFTTMKEKMTGAADGARSSFRHMRNSFVQNDGAGVEEITEGEERSSWEARPSFTFGKGSKPKRGDTTETIDALEVDGDDSCCQSDDDLVQSGEV
jgi:hypothetical protein